MTPTIRWNPAEYGMVVALAEDDLKKDPIDHHVWKWSLHYQAKYFQYPNLCRVSSSIDLGKLKSVDVEGHKVTVTSDPQLTPNHIWIGMNE